MMHHTFTHSFADDPPLGDLEVDLDLPRGATLNFSCEGGEIWVSANQAGFLHLARICAELGMQSKLGDGHHFHRSHSWGDSSGPPEVSFEVLTRGDP